MITFSEYTREEYARVCADRDEWMARALRCQARHAGLRGLQLAVQDAARCLEDPYYDHPLADIVDRLVAALKASADGGAP